MEFEVNISEAFLRKSHFRRLFRNWWKYCIAFLMIIVALTLDLISGGFSMISAFGTSAIGFCVLIYSVAWIRQIKSIKEWVGRQGEKPVIYRLTEETIEAESAFGSTKLKFDAFKRLNIQPHDTLLEFSRTGQLTLPISQLRSEILDFLIERFSAHGKVIKNLGDKSKQWR